MPPAKTCDHIKVIKDLAPEALLMDFTHPMGDKRRSHRRLRWGCSFKLL